MSDGCYFPWQPPFQPPLQPYNPPLQEHHPAPGGYWQPLDTFAQSSQECFPEAIRPSITPHPVQVDAYQHPIGLLTPRDASISDAPKQKKVRAAQACEVCRYRKQRCDEGLPCSFCKLYGLDCSYRSATPNKYLFPNAGLSSTNQLTPARFDKIVDFMVAWMSTHSDDLSALAQKIDGFESLLRKAEKIYNPGGSGTESQLLEVQDGYRARRLRLHQETTWPSAVQWPAVLLVLCKAGLNFEMDYITSAEDRPVLRLRSDKLRHGHSGGENTLESDEDCKAHDHAFPSLTEDHTISADLDLDIVRPLFTWFLANIDTFHSFLDRQQMRALFHHFAQKHGKPPCPSYSPCSSTLDEGRPLKRRKTESPRSPLRGVKVERSPTNALLLLALALAEAVKHTDPLPSTSEPLAPFTYSHKNEKLRPIPGIGYFAAAVSIMGDHMDGHDLIHAQSFMLAGLYKAQFARVREASSWYALAGRVLSHLIQQRQLFHEVQPQSSDKTPAYASFHSIQPYRSSRDDLILRASWACLLLEDEILPQLELPRSGLERFKGRLMLPIPGASGLATKPNKWPEADAEELQQSIYTAQLQLRRIVYRVHRSLFSDECLVLSEEEVARSFKHHAAALQQWRSQLAPPLRWDDQDPASTDMLHARLRHLYWEAKLVILRPFLYCALHKDPSSVERRDHHADDDSESRKSSTAQRHLCAAIGFMSRKSGEHEIQSLAELCVAAIKHSLKAYDGIGGRLIVSNVQHVAHGQYENVLCLLAAHQSGLYSPTIDAKELQQDLHKTTEFLKGISPISPTAAFDCSILEKLGEALHGPE